MRTIAKLVLLFGFVGAVAWAAAVLLLPGALIGRRSPSALEVWITSRLHHFAVPAEIRGLPNPVPLAPQVLAEARANFAYRCAICHGNDGSGRTEMGRGFHPPIPDLGGEATLSRSDGELFYVIRNGVRFTGMPAWGDENPGDDRERWKLVHFIRHLPQITPGEVREIERLNPKTPPDLALAEPTSAHEGHLHERIMGTVADISSGQMVVKTREGRTVSVRLQAHTTFHDLKGETDRDQVQVGDRTVITTQGHDEDLATETVRFAHPRSDNAHSNAASEQHGDPASARRTTSDTADSQ